MKLLEILSGIILTNYGKWA